MAHVRHRRSGPRGGGNVATADRLVRRTKRQERFAALTVDREQKRNYLGAAPDMFYSQSQWVCGEQHGVAGQGCREPIARLSRSERGENRSARHAETRLLFRGVAFRSIGRIARPRAFRGMAPWPCRARPVPQFETLRRNPYSRPTGAIRLPARESCRGGKALSAFLIGFGARGLAGLSPLSAGPTRGANSSAWFPLGGNLAQLRRGARCAYP